MDKGLKISGQTWRAYAAKPNAYGFAVLIIAACSLIGLPLRGVIAPDTVTMIYLAGVVAVAAWLGSGPALLATALSVAAFNFLFIRPYYTFRFYDRHYYSTFAVMLVTALVIGALTARASAHARIAEQKEGETRRLYDLASQLASVRGLDAMMETAVSALSRGFGVTARIWNREEALSLSGAEAVLYTADNQPRLIGHVLRTGRAAGRDAGPDAEAAALYLPLIAHGEMAGVLSLTPDVTERRFGATDILQFQTFAALIASAMLRVEQAGRAEVRRVEAESEKLRNVLLASVSHDLRTPLTVMNGGLGALLKMRRKLPREALDEVTRLWQQMNRLQSFVDNLLRLAALTSGRMTLNLQPYIVQEIVGAALAHIETQKADRTVRTRVSGSLPMVLIDGALIQQVMVNLLDNAIRHTASDGVITVAMQRASADGMVEISVSDNGQGLPEGLADQLFERFQTGTRPDSDSHGTGLGLAICKGIVQAHGGVIQAENLYDDSGAPCGARFMFTLPPDRRAEIQQQDRP